MSDAELFSKLLSGMRIPEQEIVNGIKERTGLSNFNSVIGGYLFNSGVLELRRLMAEYLISKGEEGVVASFAKAARTYDVDELHLFIDEDEDQAVNDDTPKPKK